MDKIEKMFLDLNSVLVKFWKDQGRPDKEVKIALLERMLNWYKKMGYITLDTLSEEPDKSLEEAARHSEILTYPMPDDGDIEKVMKVQEARIFHEIGFKAGAEWQASQMPMPEDTALFNKGVQEGRRLEREDMLKDAVEGEICGRVYDHINVRFADGVCKYLEPKNISHIPADVSKYSIGDKVRIVVLKAEEE